MIITSRQVASNPMAPEQFTVGQRVRIAEAIDLYPLNVYQPGLTGTVVEVAGEWGDEAVSALVRLDQTFPELAEWDNALQVGSREDSPVLPAMFEVAP